MNREVSAVYLPWLSSVLFLLWRWCNIKKVNNCMFLVSETLVWHCRRSSEGNRLYPVGQYSRTTVFFRSAEFFAIDHRLVVTTLELHVKSKKPPRYCDHSAIHLERPKDLTCPNEYVVTVSNQFGVLDCLEHLAELWDAFKYETLEDGKESIEEHPSSRSIFLSRETLDSIKESSALRLAGNSDQYRFLSRTPGALMWRQREVCNDDSSLLFR